MASKLEPLQQVLEGKRYVHAHCYRADEILMLLRVADDYGFKIRTQPDRWPAGDPLRHGSEQSLVIAQSVRMIP